VALERGSSSAQSPCPVGSAAEIHNGPGEDLERIDVALIREAAKQIDMTAYVLTDSAVIEALREAAGRGVEGDHRSPKRVWRACRQPQVRQELRRVVGFIGVVEVRIRGGGVRRAHAPGQQRRDRGRFARAVCVRGRRRLHSKNPRGID
jgi:phosphatidylserine/phosphatidylglycerophosphate/cardiolipin synthase-like enzyme